ncbi:hypothetical protein QR680_019234 [Steinernema hermaphroditum]|uniref:FERM domain-containing protein n=1 Tax=Steinernema hermaphroditum TaxID=289476 RepID=A0AA39HKE4_9BILA|nr:hypothetical protein QR680_019234 [Steinernema hermaphroditum]
MGVLTLTVLSADKQMKKTMQFDPQASVYDVCKLIRDKIGMSDAKANEYGLFRVEDDPTKCAYLENGKTLEFYLVRNGDTVEYKKKIRPLKVQTLDKSIKTLYVDESQPVADLMTVICSKIGIANHDEYSLVRTKNDAWKSTATLRDDRRAASESRANLNESKIFGTMSRNKEKKMEQLRNKLHTDEELAWLDHSKTLREQSIDEDETLLLRRKFFFSDTNVDSRDPVQLNLLYVQCRDGVLNGVHPVSREKACQLAGYQCLIEYGPFQENRQKSIDFKEVLPKEYLKSKENEKSVINQYREMTQRHDQPNNEDPKKSYVKICQELLTYGVTFFLVKEKVPGKNKLIPRLLGVNKECVMRVDAKTKEVLKEWPLEQVRRWAPSNNTFTLDFGDYLDGYYAVKTADGQKIAQLIAGYVDIIIRKKRTRDHLGIEGDEGSTMLEDVVAPAKATLVAHGQITKGYAEDGHVALPGVLRTAGTLGAPGAQYGAVSGEILQQSLGRGQRARVIESQERAQRALVGTIEASIRSVAEAEEEIFKPPEIKLPDLGDPSHRRWHEERVAVEKEGVEDRIAAMGAATAEVVQLTAVVDEVDHRVGTAIATIGSNLPEMGRGVRELAALMPDRDRAGDLVDAARKLCGAFSDFLHTVNPEHEESRTTVLAAAGRVGDFSQAVISTIEEQTAEEKVFHEDLARKARNVATSTAQLVLRAKTISAECEDQALQDKVIHSATQCAYATSQLVACARVVAPSIETPSCQDQLANAAKQVARAVEDLLVDASSATERNRQGIEVGHVQLGDIHEAARQVTSALDGLLDHVKTSPRQVTQTTEEERYEDVLRTSRRLITIQAPDSQDMVRQSESVIRHSRLLVEDLEHEAEMSPEQRDKLLSAARSVAQATSHMIDATKECQSRPQDIQSQMALRSAAEQLVQTTTEATSEQQARRTMERLEQAAKHTAAAATQTIAAASAARPLITQRTVTETLEVECTETAEYVPRLIASIRESQSAHTASEKFRAQSRLIKDSTQVIQPATRLVEVARRSVPSVTEQSVASKLQTDSQQLSTQLAELRVAINNAQQLSFERQLTHSEDLIRELDRELVEIGRAGQAGQLKPMPGESAERSSTSLMNACRQVSSTLAQLVSAATTDDRQHVGASAVDAAQSLRTFTTSVHEVCATRQDAPVDKLVTAARSVVHDSGRVFDHVRERSVQQQLSDATRAVTTSLRQVVSYLPENVHIDRAIETIRSVDHIRERRSPVELRTAASKLIESTSDLVVNMRAPQQAAAVDVFVRSYTDFHTAVREAIAMQQEMQQRQINETYLVKAREEAVNVLVRMGASAAEQANVTHTQALTQSTHELTHTVNTIVENVSRESPWQRECDSALRQIASVRHHLEQALLPVNEDTYYESLDVVTEQSKRLGEGMTGIARHAKKSEVQGVCESVHEAAEAVCGLARAAAQSAYLVGVADARSMPGRAAVIDVPRFERSVTYVKQVCERIAQQDYNQQQLLGDGTEVAKHTSALANICRSASERTSNVTVKKQFINGARDLASSTANLITAIRQLDRHYSDTTQHECTEAAQTLHTVAEQFERFVDNPDFGPVPAKISPEGQQAQRPVLTSAKTMLDVSSSMIETAKALSDRPTDGQVWQRLAFNSKDVSESIKRLVSAIRDEAPGQTDLDRSIERLNQLIQQVDNASMAAVQQQLPRTTVTEQRVHQQILHGVQSLRDSVHPLHAAATGQAEQIGRCVREQMSTMDSLVQSCIQAASISPNERQQSALFDQCKTVVEAETQLMYACKDAAGNPKAVEAHHAVSECVQLLTEAISDLEQNVNVLASDAGVIHGMVETISRSIAMADESRSVATGGSFADAQTRMMSALEDIRNIANEMTFADPSALGSLALRLSERYQHLAEASQLAVATLASPNIAQKLRVAVQKLGTACMELVKLAGQRRAHPSDQRTKKELEASSKIVVDRVAEVLAALHEGSRGTQACINAANTVSGIIGDLDTTIMFATSGTLNPARGSEKFGDHREAILKTAKALVEDTKALVAGAASNQEQLAVAAQNAVRTIVNLTDAVKSGAVSLSSDNAEAQVMVIHAVRDVAAALSNLIQATKNASGRALQDPAMGNLKEAAKIMVTNVTSLLKTVKDVEDEHQRGARALEAAIQAIDQEIRSYDSGEAPGRGTASAEDVILATKHVTNATAKAAAAAKTLQQSDLIAASNLARHAVSELLSTTRAAAHNADSAELRYRTVDSGRDVAIQVRTLLNTLLILLHRVNDPNARNQLLEASRQVAKCVGELVNCGEQLKGDAWTDPSDPTAIAENELLGAANSIEAAAIKLAQLRPRTVHKVDENLTFDEQILQAAKSIAAAVQTLVKAASAAQRELVEQGRLDPHPQLATDDYQWSEGLISAARTVAAAVHQLCEAANGLVQGLTTEEKLISAAKQVASSTAHLLVACKVKADQDSRAMQRLQSAGHAVKTATEHLVMAARQATHEDERPLVISQRMVSGIAQVMDAQANVLRMERELKEARQHLATLNKARYERGGTPDDRATPEEGRNGHMP